ncbi:MAG: DNA polymerase III subunit gamma/tau, partial [Bacteroidales bacterium]|nr:DNA polymerase III subunit gamma/tau [Bacteroidales bacterium]
MSQYIVSARKYRPDSFETLIGQDNIARTLSNSIKRGQLAHAYLFAGPRGVGKTTTARIFAKMINCSSPGPDMEPCGHCESCVSFQEGRSYCIHEMDAASNNSVDDIKALMEQVQIPPQVGKYSVYIIDEVHMLSSSAFNAFLKTLEEPPSHAIFILATTEKHKILPTILSRCQTYDFNRISIPDMVRNLRTIADKEGVKIDDESLHVIAMKADGAMRDALTIFDQTVAFCGTDVRYSEVIRNLNVLDYEYSFSLVDNFLAGDYPKALLTFDEVLSKGFNALHFIGALSSHLRDLVVAKSAGLDSLLELPESLKIKYKEQAERCPLKFLYDALAVTTACESGYKAATNPRLHIEFALMKLSFLLSAPAAETPLKAAAPAPSAPAPSAKAPEAPRTSAAPKAPDAPKVPDAPKIPEAPKTAAEPKIPEAPSAEPEAPVKARRRASKGVSIDALMEEKKVEVEEEKAPEAKEVSLTDELLSEACTKLSENYAS